MTRVEVLNCKIETNKETNLRCERELLRKKWSIFNSESVDVGRVELQGISNEFRLLILRERMADKRIQVAIGLKRQGLSSQATQTPSTKTKENGTHCRHGRGSYARKREHRQWRYDDLVHQMIDKEVLMEWLIVEGLLAKSELCPQCNKEMKLLTCNDRSDGLKWECRIQTSGKRHDGDISKKGKLVLAKQHDSGGNTQILVLVVSRSWAESDNAWT